MGIDASIFVCMDQDAELWLPGGCEVVKGVPEWLDLEPSPSHRVNCPTRYFGPVPSFGGLSSGDVRDDHYKGNWRLLCGVLLSLLANPDVSHVWYGSCDGGEVGLHLVNPEDVVHLTKVFLAKNNNKHSELEPDERTAAISPEGKRGA